MLKSFLVTVRMLALGLLAALLLLFAVLVVPVYTVFIVVWMHAPLSKVLLLTGPIAVLSLLLAVAAIAGARGKRKASR